VPVVSCDDGGKVPVGVNVIVGNDVTKTLGDSVVPKIDVGLSVAVGNDVPIVSCDDGGSVPVGVNVMDGNDVTNTLGEALCCVTPLPSTLGVSDGASDASIVLSSVGANVSDVSAVEGDGVVGTVGDGVVGTVGATVTCRAPTQLSGTTKSSVPMSVKLPPSNSNTVARGESKALVSRTSMLTRPPAKPFPLASSIVTL
jgi:hypothetical protein